MKTRTTTRKPSLVSTHYDSHQRPTEEHNHHTHDPNCRYCRQICQECKREWERMEA